MTVIRMHPDRAAKAWAHPAQRDGGGIVVRLGAYGNHPGNARRARSGQNIVELLQQSRIGEMTVRVDHGGSGRLAVVGGQKNAFTDH